jgi:hypothetical protein
MLSGSNDEIVPREHMFGLWEIAIGKYKPAGEPVQPTATEPHDRKDGTPELETDASKKQEEGIEEGDTKEHVEYASVEGVQVMLSKRTKYRVWKEFENGTHSMCACVLSFSPRLKFWQMIHVSNLDTGLLSRTSSAPWYR